MQLVFKTFVAVFVMAAGAVAAQAQPYLVDRFGRTLDTAGVTLVDFDGYMANPLINVSLSPPAGAVFPVTAALSANDARLYFSDTGTVGASGPAKSMFFPDATPIDFALSIFPDRDGLAETHQLALAFTAANGQVTNVNIPIQVRDQDLNTSPPFAVHLDYTIDVSGFYGDAAKRAIVTQAASDWTYFFAGMNLDPVPANTEFTFIWAYPDAWSGPPPGGAFVLNPSAYTGFRICSYGVNTPEQRSGGAPSLCCFQSSGGSPTTLRRSGDVAIDMDGNYNALGWFLTANDADWWTSANLGDEPNDLYSIAHHEIGHALAFNSGYPGFVDGEDSGFAQAEVVDYMGETITPDSGPDHFTGYIDRLSGVGAFGHEYFGDVPRRRWLITKLDLLLMQAIGYELRPTSAFLPLTLAAASLPAGQTSVAYAAGVTASGGVAIYDFTISDGALPPGLTLDRFTGAISGTPTAAGAFAFTVRLQDYDNGDVSEAFAINIAPGCTLGDVNGDGQINGRDIQLFARVKINGAGTPLEVCAAHPAVPAFVSLLLAQ